MWNPVSHAALATTLLVTSVAAVDVTLPPQAGTTTSQTLCTTLPPDALGTIASRSYTETTSQIDSATLKHCEYRGGAHVVSVMLAIGPEARTRFETAAKFPGVQPTPGVGDRANWEPVRGRLSVLARDRSVEVSVNGPHGTAAVRQQLAVAIARRALGL